SSPTAIPSWASRCSGRGADARASETGSHSSCSGLSRASTPSLFFFPPLGLGSRSSKGVDPHDKREDDGRRCGGGTTRERCSRVKAIVIHKFGPPDVLKYEEVPDPVPRRGEVRIRVMAATVNRVLDVAMRAGKQGQRGVALPVIPGVDCAGVIDQVGPEVAQWKIGDRVATAGQMALEPCAEDGKGYDGPTGMMGIKRPGGFAELITVPAAALDPLPEKLDFHSAAV